MAAEPRLPVVSLPGLSPDSLGNYLASLGLLLVLARKWPSTQIASAGRGAAGGRESPDATSCSTSS